MTNDLRFALKELEVVQRDIGELSKAAILGHVQTAISLIAGCVELDDAFADACEGGNS